ncbi:MAG: HNH endonuclease, partial [Myxococcales bacterium]
MNDQCTYPGGSVGGAPSSRAGLDGGFSHCAADFDRRRVWLELGYSSLFYFLHRELGLSKGSAHYRKTAAELVQRFPEIVEPLRDGRLCITTIVPLAKVLTPENRGEMLPRFFHRSKKEAMEVAATVQPATVAPRREVVTALPAASSVRAEPIEAAPASSAAAQLVQPVEPPLSATAPGVTLPLPTPRRDSAEPLSEALSRLHVTVSRLFLEKMEAARAALS